MKKVLTLFSTLQGNAQYIFIVEWMIRRVHERTKLHQHYQ